ncbi:MAG: inositol monophosphatase family protein [Anaerolineales bacterium]
MTDALQFAVELSQSTGNLLLRYYQNGVSIQLKADHSPVTEADLAADAWIAAEIGRAFPQDGLISEERSPIYRGEGAAIWVVDPLDGTANFGNNIPLWGVSIARVVDGSPQVAALHFPALNETFSAQRGAPAQCNGKVLQANLNHEAGLYAHCSRVIKKYRFNLPQTARIFGSTAYNLCSVARGSVIADVELRPQIWDLAAGWLVVQQSGGVIRTWDNSLPFPLQSGVDYRTRHFATLAARSPHLAQHTLESMQLRET